MVQIIIIMVLAFTTLILAVVGLTMKTERAIILQRLRAHGFEAADQAPVLVDDLAPPFAERVLRPALQRLGRIGASLSPGEGTEIVRRKLESAGNPYGLSPTEFSALKGLTFLLGLVIGAVAAGALGLKINQAIAVVAVSAGLGFLAPGQWLKSKIATRKNDIQRALPNTLDLLNVSIEAGLGFDGALARIVEKTTGPLADEFARALRDMRVGKSRTDALRDMAARADVMELSGFVAAVYQAEELGASLTSVLRIQGHMIRSKRRIRAREIAATLPVRMLFPLVFFVFPSIFIVILGPGALQVVRSFLTR